jgi:hypothetical protein
LIVCISLFRYGELNIQKGLPFYIFVCAFLSRLGVHRMSCKDFCNGAQRAALVDQCQKMNDLVHKLDLNTNFLFVKYISKTCVYSILKMKSLFSIIFPYATGVVNLPEIIFMRLIL